ncbi:hypothetical protein FACHB389_32840 [Nostoc calcicola FACHB-389]|nr:ribbon-helix-helix protein, CopG family [Nostoc calcicola FACHB-3891]OKH20376.1 hypothetical protein FACHB389_32840 [Nostoc calcicola FACHB-389]
MIKTKIGYKMPKGYLKGKARRRKVPIIHEECKAKLNLTLTPTAIDKLTQAAKRAGISRSELIEDFARSLC